MNFSINHFSKIVYLSVSIMFLISTSSCIEKYIYQFSVEQEIAIDTLNLQAINVYLETSASMKGYVNSNVSGKYPLKDVIPFMVTDIDNSFGVVSNLYTISDKQQKYRHSNAQFFDQLRTGNIFTGKSSKLQNIFANVISETRTGVVSILITDCIPDLGKINTQTEGSKITSHIYNRIAGNKSLGVAVFKYNSDFNGTHYFNRRNNDGVSYRNRPFYNKVLKNRPFYIWVFGEKTLVAQVLLEDIFKEFEDSNGYNLSIQQIDAGLLKHPKSGKILINSETNTMVIQEIEKQKPATFTIGINLKNVTSLQKEQILDTLNYKVLPNYIQETVQLGIKDKNLLLSEKIKDKSVIEDTGYTHFIQPTFSDFDPNTKTISVNILNTESRWINKSDLKEDVDISEKDLEHKTFGFNFITNAFNKAFFTDEPLVQLTLTKQQQK